MNPANRIKNILSEINTMPNNTIATKAFADVFKVKGAIKISSKLRICNMQIEKLEHGTDEITINQLKAIFDDKDMCRNLQPLREHIKNNISVLKSIAYYMSNENNNEKELTEIADLVEQMKAKINKAKVSDEYKDYLYSYTNELMEGIVEMHLGGIDNFQEHLIKATGILIIHRQAFEDSKIIDEAKNIFKKSMKIFDTVGAVEDVIEYIEAELLENKEV